MCKFPVLKICLVMDQLFEIPCKILHCPSGKDLITSVFPKLEQHFQNFACPVMMGGDRDASSKGILGTCISENEPHLLILVSLKKMKITFLHAANWSMYFKTKKKLCQLVYI